VMIDKLVDNLVNLQMPDGEMITFIVILQPRCCIGTI